MAGRWILYELARMVGATVGGVVAVVGGDDQQVVVAHSVQDAAEAPVEVLERQAGANRLGVSASIAILSELDA